MRPDLQFNLEYLPATRAARQELVLLHGWGSNREIWRPLLVALRPWANISLLDIPGCSPACGQNDPLELTALLAALVEHCPPTAVYVGWSLGGQLAVELATRYPQRVVGLITLCANPRFVAEDDWPGMAPASFAGFSALVARDPGAGLRRFDSLQVAGADHSRALLRALPRQGRENSGGQLLSGLRWLGDLDQRAQLPLLSQPQLHLLGERDGLVPARLAQPLEKLLCDVPTAQVQLMSRVGHVAPLDSSTEVASALRAFLQTCGLLWDERSVSESVTKQDVARSFSRAASTYDSVASLQRDVGTRLLESLEHLQLKPETVLDLGCGTGFFAPALRQRYPGADYIGLDLAEGMLEFARGQHPEAGSWLAGDAEALPLAAESLDLVFSSLAVQWCARPQHLFAELARVLRPGGICVFSTLGPETLCELRGAWAAVDSHQHVNSFLPAAELASAARSVPGVQLALRTEHFCMRYQRVRELLDELKTLGAHNMNSGRPTGLSSRRALQGMLQAYESWRDDGLLPATYDVIFAVMEKQ